MPPRGGAGHAADHVLVYLLPCRLLRRRPCLRLPCRLLLRRHPLRLGLSRSRPLRRRPLHRRLLRRRRPLHRRHLVRVRVGVGVRVRVKVRVRVRVWVTSAHRRSSVRISLRPFSAQRLRVCCSAKALCASVYVVISERIIISANSLRASACGARAPHCAPHCTPHCAPYSSECALYCSKCALYCSDCADCSGCSASPCAAAAPPPWPAAVLGAL
eukprot:scaffold23953_cov59-Phaeocystis_antarctica.AAC.6